MDKSEEKDVAWAGLNSYGITGNHHSCDPTADSAILMSETIPTREERQRQKSIMDCAEKLKKRIKEIKE
ncbi:MAG: hypothetical protein WC476_08805 [Phycisphaerae bacterium]|jgi:hypothetical protein